MFKEVNDEDMSNSTKPIERTIQKEIREQLVTISAVIQVERWLSPGLMGKLRQVKQQEIPPHEATHMHVFPWEYCFVFFPEGLFQEIGIGGITWRVMLHTGHPAGQELASHESGAPALGCSSQSRGCR